jgi:poly(3-hydroxyalkanoate) synthetase
MKNSPFGNKGQGRWPLADWLFGWPAWFLAEGSRAMRALDESLNQERECAAPEPDAAPGDNHWTTPNRIHLELGTMRLRDFSRAENGPVALICAPFALHRATIADFAPGHSLVETLLGNGIARIHVTDWRSATTNMRHLSIDNYLADLNVAVDELGPPVDLIGLCQGGWLALAFAARFPQKVGCLVLAGAPVDIAAADSKVASIAKSTPMAVFERLVRAGGGCVLGQRMLHMWSATPSAPEEKLILQIGGDGKAASTGVLLQRFRDWYAETVDLPGDYYLQVVSWIFKENRLAEGAFVALGRRIDLATIRHPIFLLAGRDDDLAAVDQVFGAARYVSTAKSDIETLVEPCRHHSLFLGAKVLRHAWPRIARWLARYRDIRQTSQENVRMSARQPA